MTSINDVSVVTVGVPGGMPLDGTTKINLTTESPHTRPAVIKVNVPGPQGPPGVFELGSTSTGAPGTNASATVDKSSGTAVINLVIPRGDVGAVGPANTLTIGSVSTGPAGSAASASLTGTAPNQTLNLVLPKGDQGPSGPQGVQGAQGIQGPQGAPGSDGKDGAGIQIAGQVSTYSALPANLTSADSGKAYVVSSDGKLYIWSGTGFPASGQGNTFVGPAGPANSLMVGTVTTSAPGSSANATLTGTAPNQVLNLTLPTGATGPANVLNIGMVSTGAAGSNASVTITGTAPSQTLNFTIPQGLVGAQGPQGPQGPQGQTGNGVLVLNPGDTVPANTPANTVIYRPSVKAATFFWGSGTQFPSSGVGYGDTYFHTGIGCLFLYNGYYWRQSTVPALSGWSSIQNISTNWQTSLHAGFRVINTDTSTNSTNMYGAPSPYFIPSGNTFQWNGNAWEYIGGGNGNPTTQIITPLAGFTQFGQGWGYFTASKFGGIVTLTGLLYSPNAASSVKVASLPATFRPQSEILTIQICPAGPARVDVIPDGSINLITSVAATSWFTVNTSFPVNN